MVYETNVGAMNLAPTKLSGQYKVVVGIDDVLYLDNYCGRRVRLDMSQSFIEQVGRFLQVEQQLASNSKLQYGAFRNSKVYSYHIPLYLGDVMDSKTYPELFCLLLPNITDYQDINQIYSTSSILMMKSLKDLGFHAIFDEIEKYFTYPLYLNWEQHSVTIFGYSYRNERMERLTHSILKEVGNQAYIETANNYILNLFERNHLIFPKFINIEFEFDYKSSTKDFQDFFGFLGTKVTPSDKQIDGEGSVKFLSYNNPKFGWEPFSNTDTTYTKKLYDIQIQEVAPKMKQFRFGISYLFGTEIFTIKINGEVDYQYQFEHTANLEHSIRAFCLDVNNRYNFVLKFSYKKVKNTFIVTCDYLNETDTQFTFEPSVTMLDIDNQGFEPKEILTTDVMLVNDVPDVVGSSFVLDNKKYTILEQFKHSGYNILRLDSEHNLSKLTVVHTTKEEEKIQCSVKPIQLYSFYSAIVSLPLYENKKYVEQLKLFKPDGEVNQSIFDATIQEFSKEYNEQNEIYAYVDQVDNKLDDFELLKYDLHNESIVKNMMFASGSNSHLLPHTYNYAREYYKQNCSVNTYNAGFDYYKFAWFLINAKCPDYLVNDKRAIRYFKDGKPQMYSRLYRVSDSLCECVFLGIKYQLPLKFEGFKFCVALNPNNTSNLDSILIDAHIDYVERSIILMIDKFLDFNDLIRGTDYTKEPLIDLSLFYNVKSGFNLTSFYSTDIAQLKMKLEPFYNHDVGFMIDESVIAHNWITEYKGKKYVCVQVLEGINLRDIYAGFENGTDIELSLYTEIVEEENGTVTVHKYQICNVVFKSVILHDTYIWCTDIELRWFQNSKNFYIDHTGTIHKLGAYGARKQLAYSRQNKTDDFIMAQVGTEQVKIMNPNKVHSFAQEWFELERLTTVGLNGHTDVSETLRSMVTKTQRDLRRYNIKKDNISDFTINLFDTNQIWDYFRLALPELLHYRLSSAVQVKREINKLSIPNIINVLSQYNNNVLINHGDEYIQIRPIETESNMVIWNMLDSDKIVTIERYNTGYYPLLFETNEIKFQLDKNKRYDSMFSMFHENFNGVGTSATGFWEELTGNILSTLFVGDSIVCYVEYKQEGIDIREVLSEHVSENKYVILHKNEKLLSKSNMNVDTYIKQKYVEYLLSGCYKLSKTVTDDLGLSLNYHFDTKDSNRLYVQAQPNTVIKLTFETT